MQSLAHLMMLLVWSQQVQHLPQAEHHLLQHFLLFLQLAHCNSLFVLVESLAFVHNYVTQSGVHKSWVPVRPERLNL
jgi:hypothetical protein